MVVSTPMAVARPQLLSATGTLGGRGMVVAYSVMLYTPVGAANGLDRIGTASRKN